LHPEVHSDLVNALIEGSRSELPGVREAARSCWGYLAPRSYLSSLTGEVKDRIVPDEWLAGLGNAIAGIGDEYYGHPMCPSLLSYLDGDLQEIRHHYLAVQALLRPLCAYRNLAPHLQDLRELAVALHSMLPPADQEQVPPLPHMGAPGQR
jgi:hypothetical protein